jgi:hypothetical protein
MVRVGDVLPQAWPPPGYARPDVLPPRDELLRRLRAAAQKRE